MICICCSFFNIHFYFSNFFLFHASSLCLSTLLCSVMVSYSGLWNRWPKVNSYGGHFEFWFFKARSYTNHPSGSQGLWGHHWMHLRDNTSIKPNQKNLQIGQDTDCKFKIIYKKKRRRVQAIKIFLILEGPKYKI